MLLLENILFTFTAPEKGADNIHIYINMENNEQTFFLSI